MRAISIQYRIDNIFRILIYQLIIILVFSNNSFSIGLKSKVDALEKQIKKSDLQKKILIIKIEGENLLAIAKKENDYDNVVRINLILSDMFMQNMFQRNLAQTYLFEASKDISKCKDKELELKLKYFFSKFDYCLKNYQSSKRQLIDLVDLVNKKQFKKAGIKKGALYYALGTVWEAQKNSDSAKYYYRKSIEIYKMNTKDKSVLINPLYSIINIDIEDGNTNDSILSRIQNLKVVCKSFDKYITIARIHCLTATYYINKHLPNFAIIELENAKKIANDLSLDDIRLECFKIYSLLYKSTNNYLLSVTSLENYSELKDSLTYLDQNVQITNMDIMFRNIEIEKKISQEKLKNQKSATNRKMLIFYLFIAFGGLLITFMFIFLLRIKNQNLKRTSELNLKLKSTEIKYKEEQLSNFATDIIRRIQFSRELQQEFKKIQELSNEKSVIIELKNLISKINNEAHLNKQIVQIQEKVEDINNNFYFRLSTLCPNLTEYDKQLCSMIKLNLSQSELAIICGIEINSLKTKKYRLKKKLGLTVEQDLIKYLKSI